MAGQFWSFRERDERRDLFITDEIAQRESWWSDTVTPNLFRRQLLSGRGEVRVWIDSPGGDAFAGAAIYEMLKEYSRSGQGRTVAMITLAASAASLIAMACDEIRISMLGTVMIHEPWSIVAGKAVEHRATAEVLENIRQAQIRAYSERTGQSEEKILELMQGSDGRGTYMNANQAIELGFADHLIDGADIDGETMAATIAQARVASLMTVDDAPEEPVEKPEDEAGGLEEARAELMRAVLRSMV